MKWWQRLILRILSFICSVFVKISSSLFAYIYECKKCPLQTIQSPLLTKSSVYLANMIRNRQVKCKDLVDIFVKRIKEINPSLNAVVCTRFDEALNEAIIIDEILDRDEIPEEYSYDRKPFLGVPFTAKEAFAVTGLPNTSGLLCRKNVIAERDADAISLYRSAGAIPIALTNCSELCMWYESHNLLYGRTNNAYHQGRIVGGSSGGEGCVQSFGGAAFGLGSDIGGSIRMPAFFNGIFGHKPTTGVVSNEGQFPLARQEAVTFLSTGPMCRYATDLLPLFKVLVKPEFADSLKIDRKVDLSKLKYYYMLDDGGSICSPVDPQIKDTILKSVSYLEGTTGVPVNRVSISKMRYSFDIWTSMMSTSGNESFCSLMGNLKKPVNAVVELLLWLMCYGRHTLAAIGLGIAEKIRPPQKVQQAHRSMCKNLKEEFRNLLGDDGVFIYPSHPRPAPYHNQPLVLIPNFSYTAIFNVLGMPSTCVPMGLSKEGVPIGFQVVAWQNNDRLTIAVAEELERAFGGWVPPFQSTV